MTGDLIAPSTVNKLTKYHRPELRRFEPLQQKSPFLTQETVDREGGSREPLTGFL